MSIQQHVIKKLVVDLLVNKQKQALSLQDKAISAVEYDLVEVVEEVFSNYSGPDTMIEIDKLELNLGEILADNFVKELSEKLSEKLTSELSKKEILQENIPAYHEKGKVLKNEQHLFIYFLKTGMLPWWNEEKISITAIFDRQMEEREKEFVKAILPELRSERVFSRFIQQFSDRRIILFFVHAVAYRFQAMDDFLTSRIPEAVKKLSVERAVAARKIIWQSIIGYLDANNFEGFVEEELDSVIFEAVELKKAVTDFSTVARREKTSLQKNNPDRREDISEKKDKIEEVNNFENSIEKRKDSKAAFSEEKNKTGEETGLKRNAEKENTDENNFQEIEYPADELYLKNAGLVIYWPYLTMFFKALNLLEQNDFKDLYARNKGICLLHYLANSQTPAEEHELFLNKLLCGWSPQESPQIIELTKEEKEEADHLAAAVVDHWKVLKSTSPDGLRETFIQRAGILVFEDGNRWKLRVEKKGVDVLMSALPWGFSIVKLPWMEHAIHVEW